MVWHPDPPNSKHRTIETPWLEHVGNKTSKKETFQYRKWTWVSDGNPSLLSDVRKWMRWREGSLRKELKHFDTHWSRSIDMVQPFQPFAWFSTWYLRQRTVKRCWGILTPFSVRFWMWRSRPKLRRLKRTKSISWGAKPLRSVEKQESENMTRDAICLIRYEFLMLRC